jgi:hypothetical protein
MTKLKLPNLKNHFNEPAGVRSDRVPDVDIRSSQIGQLVQRLADIIKTLNYSDRMKSRPSFWL